MELEGLKRCHDELESKSVTIRSLTSDRHVSISKHLRENCHEIVHYYDTWHISKGEKLILFSSDCLAISHKSLAKLLFQQLSILSDILY